MDFLARGVLLIGIFLLLGALLPIGFIIIQIRDSETRIKWITLSCFILLAIIGYFIYTLDGIHSTGYVVLLTPLVFFLGSCFVWLVTMVSLQTANNVRRITRLEEQIITDPLMGIYNRRFFDKRIIEEITRAQRYNMPLSVFMIDIDHLKPINDKFGHKAGDTILINLGKLMLQASRSSDIVSRFGGDAICFIAPNTKALDAKNIAEHLCKLIASTPLIHARDLPNKANPPHITVSIGVANLWEIQGINRSIVELADEAMYDAKRLGRNCVAVAINPIFDNEPVVSINSQNTID